MTENSATCSQTAFCCSRRIKRPASAVYTVPKKSASNTVVLWRELGETENEWTSHTNKILSSLPPLFQNYQSRWKFDEVLTTTIVHIFETRRIIKRSGTVRYVCSYACIKGTCKLTKAIDSEHRDSSYSRTSWCRGSNHWSLSTIHTRRPHRQPRNCRSSPRSQIFCHSVIPWAGVYKNTEQQGKSYRKHDWCRRVHYAITVDESITCS